MFELFDPEADYDISIGSNLPHWFQNGVTYFVTWRTEDSIPSEVADNWHRARRQWLSRFDISPSEPNWKRKLAGLSKPNRKEYHQRFSVEYLQHLDQGYGKCELKKSELSKIVADSLRHFDGDRYHLGDFVIMPNHVHILVCLVGETELLAQCYSWKKFTATKINRSLGGKGRFWQEESFDHMVRSPAQFDAIRRYIADNPKGLKTGEYLLCTR